MNPKNKSAALSGLALGLIAVCFILLLQEFVISKKAWQEIPRLFAGLAVPVPLAIFLAFCLAHREGPKREDPAPLKMLLLLAASFFGTMAIGFIGHLSNSDISSLMTGPIIAESSVFSASVLNFLFFRSPPIAAVLSGASTSLTAIVIFLT
jgi:hypothetical protein